MIMHELEIFAGDIVFVNAIVVSSSALAFAAWDTFIVVSLEAN